MMAGEWQVQEAKADLRGLLRAAEDDGPQTITRHGKPVAVVLSAAEFERLARLELKSRVSLLEFFAAWPPLDLPERDRDTTQREIDL
jgi:prevent-host-death family protein